MKRIQACRNLATCALISIATTSCSTFRLDTPSEKIAAHQESPNWRMLPYHVEIIPLHADDVRALAPNGGGEFKLDYLQREASAQNNIITERVREVLGRNVFVKVDIMPAPKGAELANMSKDAYYARVAEKRGADLILAFDKLEYNPQIETNSKKWSYLAYLFGPIELLVHDRSYESTDTSLAITLYDTASMQLPESGEDADLHQWQDFRLKQGANAVRQFRLRPDKINLRYKDRVPKGKSGFVQFWKVLLLPSSWLYKEEPSLAADLTERFAMGLANDLAMEIVEGDHAFITHPDVTNSSFRFDARGLRITDKGNYLMASHQIEGSDPGGLFDGCSITIGGSTIPCDPIGPNESPLSVAKGSVGGFQVLEAKGQPNRELWNIRFYIPKSAVQPMEASSPKRQRQEAGSWFKIQLHDSYNYSRAQSWTVEVPSEIKRDLNRRSLPSGSGTVQANE